MLLTHEIHCYADANLSSHVMSQKTASELSELRQKESTLFLIKLGYDRARSRPDWHIHLTAETHACISSSSDSKAMAVKASIIYNLFFCIGTQ